ncbi:hypothetical protein QBC47DRAFT_405490 [Echria macrotheca]|uniref:Uncharacterized protein n=1 Tax=Echria macrotheca TaxID=438768 RepID=A0AAJ0BAD1_9PEZI|nr:hypothetical protein QBC47DRAFT_405490 [Echria macrotheca]
MKIFRLFLVLTGLTTAVPRLRDPVPGVPGLNETLGNVAAVQHVRTILSNMHPELTEAEIRIGIREYLHAVNELASEIQELTAEGVEVTTPFMTLAQSAFNSRGRCCRKCESCWHAVVTFGWCCFAKVKTKSSADLTIGNDGVGYKIGWTNEH